MIFMDVPFHKNVQKLMLPMLFRLPNPQLNSNAVGTSVHQLIFASRVFR